MLLGRRHKRRDCKRNIIYCVQVMLERTLIKSRGRKLFAGLNCLLKSESETNKTGSLKFKLPQFNQMAVMMITDLCKALALCRIDSKCAKQRAL